ncbi:putative gustatory receptor 28b [Macrosteles quadrilineatus]|uniref:putative gustatory receptor 28b n=1 Tax=Macrosteles quadrilineatus TaxID=74068 RepID=UPI0023E0BE02|nr:putative gustatory receptor 28b [Macrosteles quadrilineatus]
MSASEANNMENIVHELMNETEDKDILRELEDFSLELIHGKVVFTAFDCFTIDYSLFTKIIGAVASYVIIFLQFGNFDYQQIFNVERNETASS